MKRLVIGLSGLIAVLVSAGLWTAVYAWLAGPQL